VDRQVLRLIKGEEKRQSGTINLIPSENYSSAAVRQTLSSCLTDKYAEGYPGRRYYQGNEIVDQVEKLAVARAKKLFGVPHANVQPYSGSPANMAVYLALCRVGETVMGMDLRSGGHLTHGALINFSGRLFKSVSYGVGEDGWIDYNQVEKLAKKHQPKLIWAGATAYPRIFDWEKFGKIADSVGAFLVADIAHYAGLIVGGVYPSPVPFADVVTTTTHKTLRGPRGALIMVTKKGLKKEPKLPEKIDRWVFPGLQGGPHLNTIAAVAVALREAQGKLFKKYARQVVKNAQVLAGELIKFGFDLVSGGTDNHLMLIDLRAEEIGGKQAAVRLEKAGVVVNANSIPNDLAPPAKPSGIRLGTSAVTTRGMKEREMRMIGGWIKESVKRKTQRAKLKEIRRQVWRLCKNFPLP
jgi:glycine hydroxymethyltransferase